MDGEKKQRAAIDWFVIRQRLDAARTAAEQAWLPDAQATARILQARARALAREPAQARDGDALEIVEFMLAHERYGVETSFVREIHPLTNLTPLPCTPAFVLGIVNLRGEIVSVIDLKKFFDLPDKGLTDLNKVVVLQSATMRFGVLADAVLGVRRVPVAEIQPSLPTLTGVREEYLKGVTSERTIILDAENLLADGKIVVQEQVIG
ncbi:MAG: chemotaxis protein [Betaproteobacteria bacterium RIFCSPLOWO2_02_FULL_66_14]|nr:MAG: chemotaxis protein [Betaproteobacteria bacterium RIFCSPLOWO2_02_FULL_66_14]